MAARSSTMTSATAPIPATTSTCTRSRWTSRSWAQAWPRRLFGQLRVFDANGVALGNRYTSINDTGMLSLTLSAGTYYVGVSGSSNTSYDPKVAGSGAARGYTGDYGLKLQLQRTGSSHLNSIVASVASGTAATAGVAAAIVGQTIVLHGGGIGRRRSSCSPPWTATATWARRRSRRRPSTPRRKPSAWSCPPMR